LFELPVLVYWDALERHLFVVVERKITRKYFVSFGEMLII
jgi:hypothetical protein